MSDEQKLLKEAVDVICSATVVQTFSERVWISVDRAAWERFSKEEDDSE